MEMRRHPIWGQYAQHLMSNFAPPKVRADLGIRSSLRHGVSAPTAFGDPSEVMLTYTCAAKAGASVSKHSDWCCCASLAPFRN